MTLKSVAYAVIINLAKPIARNVRWLYSSISNRKYYVG